MSEELVKKACLDMWRHALSLCDGNCELADKRKLYSDKVQSVEGEPIPAPSSQEIDARDYNTLVKKQESETVGLRVRDYD